MQGYEDGGLDEELREAEREYLITRRAYKDADARLVAVRERVRAARMTPEQRRAEIRQRAREAARRVLAAVGILWFLDLARKEQDKALTAVALTGAAVAGSVAVIAPDGAVNVWPEGPPAAIAEAPKAAAPTALPDDDDAPAPTNGSPLGSGELGDEPLSTSFLAVPTSTPSPEVTTTPSPPGTPGPSPSASPSPTRPPPPSPSPSPTATPTPTATATATPSPTPTITATTPPSPTPSPTQVDDPLVCVDVDELLEACLDLELPVLDGLMGRPRILYG